MLVTGHTGFKGAWLSLWLQSLGARVSGLAGATPRRPSLYELAGIGARMQEQEADVRDGQAVREAMRALRPEIVVHLAAQPMVRRSLRDPVETYEVNVIGTVNVLDAVRRVGEEVRAVVVVTSDKCYENPRRHPPGSPARRSGASEESERRAPEGEARAERFTEDDPLGGDDPYSSSKACAELVAGAYRSSFFSSEHSPRVATARAGNVIGGGDWGEDRLIADAVRAVQSGRPLQVRNPHAVRPWQHVLSPLSGYLILAQELWRTDRTARAWNFGPRDRDARTVQWIVERLDALWDGELEWELDQRENPPEAAHLALDSSSAEGELGWRAAWDLGGALERVVTWHRAERRGDDMRRVSLDQIAEFV